MKVNPSKIIKDVNSKHLKEADEILAKTASSPINCNESLAKLPIDKELAGRTQVLLQNSPHKKSLPKTKEEVAAVLDEIAGCEGMRLSRHYGDNHISFGTPIKGFSGLCNDEMSAKCLRDSDGFLKEIFVLDKRDKSVFVYSHDKTLKKHFGPSQMKALFEYKYHPEAIHDYLRQGRIKGLEEETALQGFIKSIENIFKDDKRVWKTEKPVTLYRALQDRLSPEEQNALTTIGGVFKDRSFVSTSQKYETAQRFAGGNPILEIEVAPNTKYIDMDALFNIDREHWREQEFLLNKGTDFLVTGFDKAKNIIKVKCLDSSNI